MGEAAVAFSRTVAEAVLAPLHEGLGHDIAFGRVRRPGADAVAKRRLIASNMVLLSGEAHLMQGFR